MSYESPIKLHKITDDMLVGFGRELEEDIVLTINSQIEIEVNKEQLLHALKYDCEQYKKGYADGHADGYQKGYDDAINRILEMAKKGIGGPDETE